MRILIGHDGSGCAVAALDDLRLAGLPPKADVLVLAVVDSWMPGEDGPGEKGDETLPGLKDLRAKAHAAIERQRGVAEDGAARLRSLFPGWNVKAEVCADSPAWAIIKRAEGSEGGVHGKPADLVVVGSHGYGGIKRLVLGSVSQRVISELRRSVRIARDMGRDGAGTGIPKIVVGVDGSAGSRAAVDAVASRAWPRGTRILVAYVDQNVHMGIDGGVTGIGGAYVVWGGDPVMAMEGSLPASSGATGGNGARIVAEAEATLRGRCPQVSVSTVVKPGDPRHELLKLAEGWKEGSSAGADCVFVGAKGVRGLERFLLGSVSMGIAMNAHCSVEIVHPQA